MSKDSSPFFLELGSSKIILSYSDTIHNKIITEEENILNDKDQNNLFLHSKKTSGKTSPNIFAAWLPPKIKILILSLSFIFFSGLKLIISSLNMFPVSIFLNSYFFFTPSSSE